MKKILAIHTGGTISMSKGVDGGVRPNQHNPIANQPIHDLNVKIENETMFNLPSPHVTPKVMLEVKERIIQAEKDGVDGVVVTHGTDTLEETAYFLDLTLPHHIPIVVLGAMRSSNELGSDGPHNFKTAIDVALSESSKDRGVMVVMNDEIYAAQYVTKTHTTNVATFKSPLTGPIGVVNHERPYFFQTVNDGHYQNISKVINHVYLLKAYAGMDGTLIDAIDNHQTNGLVIEGTGAGNMPPKTLPALKHLIDKHIPVVLVSRCFNGLAQDVYEYEGGGIQLQRMGITICRGLNGQKARIKLIVGLSANLSGENLAKYMGNAIP
ncbi:L-asparaginase [Philodulcilactobacillus myokoensis]|uniref:L-asparaginase n=1 Tax=Philodulcilactobacillus myokoensis TaxID=2929573 RepID=A0A9W6ERU4_9LACO|nr:asparaginase [Philodulcilactobacillus myokoensis]GLB46551.1 L-asparaginase [Philodulcilactobacillus myokoensis]